MYGKQEDIVTLRIAGGQLVSRGQFPFMGYVKRINLPGDSHGCGAVLIHELWAITAKHCMTK